MTRRNPRVAAAGLRLDAYQPPTLHPLYTSRNARGSAAATIVVEPLSRVLFDFG